MCNGRLSFAPPLASLSPEQMFSAPASVQLHDALGVRGKRHASLDIRKRYRSPMTPYIRRLSCHTFLDDRLAHTPSPGLDGVEYLFDYLPGIVLTLLTRHVLHTVVTLFTYPGGHVLPTNAAPVNYKQYLASVATSSLTLQMLVCSDGV